MNYESNHAAQRIALRRVADALSVSTTGVIGKRRVPKPLMPLRLELYNRIWGDGWGTINVRSMAEFDKRLATALKAEQGKLGSYLKTATDCLRAGRDSLEEAKALCRVDEYEAAVGPFKRAGEYFKMARSAQDQYEATQREGLWEE